MGGFNMKTRADRGALWRSRWAAIGAAVAVSVGAGGIVHFASASSGAPSDFVSITPVRVLDTRDPVNVGLAGPFVSATPQDLTITGSVPTTGGPQVVVPAGATGVVLNVTVVAPASDGFISVRPADAPGAPATSSLNFVAGTTVPNAVTVAVPTAGADAGKIEITYDAYGSTGPTADVLVDVVGYYVPEAPETGVVSVPWSSFLPASTGEYSGYGNTAHVGRFLTGVGGNGGNRLLASVELPHGATITSVSFGIWDNGASDPTADLYRFASGASTGEDVASATVTGAEASVRTFEATIDPTRAVVDNTTYTYVLSVFMIGWTAASNVEIDWVNIGYTLG
jgi:hypothetical protein